MKWGDFGSSLLYTSPSGMQNDFDECIFFFFIPPTPPWSLTREVPQCHFHLNVNLKAVSLRLAWMLICFESLFASDHNGYVKLWAVVSLNQHTFFFFPKSSYKCFPTLRLSKRFLSTLIFSQWQCLAPRPMGENKTLCCFGSWIAHFFLDWWIVLFWFVTVLPISYSSCSQSSLKDTSASRSSCRQSVCSA